MKADNTELRELTQHKLKKEQNIRATDGPIVKT